MSNTSYEPMRSLLENVREDIRDLRAHMKRLDDRLGGVITREEFDEYQTFRRSQTKFFTASTLTTLGLIIAAVSVIIASR